MLVDSVRRWYWCWHHIIWSACIAVIRNAPVISFSGRMLPSNIIRRLVVLVGWGNGSGWKQSLGTPCWGTFEDAFCAPRADTKTCILLPSLPTDVHVCTHYPLLYYKCIWSPQAIATRDSLAKALYGALFDWIVDQVRCTYNQCIPACTPWLLN